MEPWKEIPNNVENCNFHVLESSQDHSWSSETEYIVYDIAFGTSLEFVCGCKFPETFSGSVKNVKNTKMKFGNFENVP